MTKRPLYLPITVLILWIVTVGAIVALPLFQKNKNIESSSGLKYHGEVCAWVNDKLVGCNHNLITNAGKDIVYYALTGSLQNATYIAVANNTVPQSPSDTALQGEWTTCGLAKGPADSIVRNGYGNWTITKSWTVTCDNVIVNATGLYNATGPLFAETTIPLHYLYSTDILRISWTIWVS
jgi:hypothetical protein